MASNGYARISGGVNAGVKLVDINPERQSNGDGVLNLGVDSSGSNSFITVCGYKKISLINIWSGRTFTYKYKYKNGTESTATTIPSSWSNYEDIPTDVIGIIINGSYSVTTYGRVCYSLLA